jgi:hypothetical protein
MALPSILMDPFADLPEPPQFLGVEVEQLAWSLALVAHHRRSWRSWPPGVSQPAEHLPDRGRREPELGGEDLRPVPAVETGFEAPRFQLR